MRLGLKHLHCSIISFCLAVSLIPALTVATLAFALNVAFNICLSENSHVQCINTGNISNVLSAN